MANFLAYYNICPIHDTKEFLGLSRDSDDGNIITTLGRNIIIVIKLTNQKQIRSWTVLDKLSSKVVFDKKSKNYVGVFGNKYLRCWDENVTDLNKIKKLKFQKNIVDLICSEKDETIIMYSDGTCESLTSGIETRQDHTHNNNSELNHTSIDNANLFYLHDGRKMLTYFHKNEKTKFVELVTIFLNESDLKPLQPAKFYNLDGRNSQNVTLSGCTVVEGPDFPSLLTIWSDKRVFIMSLNDNLSENVPGNILSIIDSLNFKSPVSVLGVSKNCIAIYSANSGQEGASLILYNTQFKVIKAKQFFKIYFDFSRLWIVDNHILLAMGQNLSVVTFRVTKELLSEIIGSQVSNDFQSYVLVDLINEEHELENSLHYSTQHDNLSESFEEYEENVDNSLVKCKQADGKTLPFRPIKNFDEEFNSFCSQNMDIDIISMNTTNDEYKINLLSNVNDSGSFHSKEVEIIAEELKKCGASEHEISEKLLKLLIKVENDEDIATFLRRYTSISEKMLSKVLKYAMTNLELDVDCNTIVQNGLPPNEHKKFSQEEEELANGEIDNCNLLIDINTKIVIKKKTDLVNLILSCSFENESLTRHIRNEIDLDQALVLIQHLFNLIDSDKNYLEKRNNFFECNEDMKILQWFGIILNTHFQQLALSRDLQLIELLVKWHNYLSKYKENLRDLEESAAVLYNLVNKKQISKETKNSKWYSIEEVELF